MATVVLSGRKRGRIRSVTLDDAKTYAEMMTRSESGWPWSMSGGVPYTPRMAREGIEGSAALGQYVADLGDKLVGVCEVYRGFMDKNSGYIGFLNVEPDYHGKGFGKRLLRAGIDRAIKDGVERVDLDTWSGNLKALPLYKKMGFFWVPETSVNMVNFIPIALKHPMFKEFFEKNPDWYDVQVRDLSPKQDLLERDGIRIYEYCFKSGDDEIRAVADREGLWITGGTNRNLEIWIHPENEVSPEGFHQLMFWEIENRTDHVMKATLMVNPPESAEIVKPPPDSFEIPAGKRIKLEGIFRVDPKSDRKERWEEPERINTILMIDEETMNFRTGVGRKGAMSFDYDPRYLLGQPGARTDLHVRLRNRTKLELKGRVTATPVDDRIRISPKIHNFRLEPEGYAGFDCEVEMARDAPTSCLPITFSPVFLDKNGKEIPGKEEIMHPSCVRPGELLAYVERNGKVLHLDNDLIRASLDLRRGGRMVVRDRLSEEMLVTGLSWDALGPPFWPTEFDKMKCDYSLERGDGFIKASLYMKSELHEGLTLFKELTIRRGWPVITVQYGLVNNHNKPRSFKLRTRAGASLNRATVYLPTKYGLISDKLRNGYPSWGEDTPRKPKDYAENWVAFEGYKDRLFTVGAIWPREGEELDIGGTGFGLKLDLKVPANGRVMAPAFHIYAADGTWLGLREIWRKLTRDSVCREKRYLDIRKRRPLSLGFSDRLLSPSLGPVEGTLEVSNLRAKRETGSVEVKPPVAWHVTPGKIRFKNLSWKTRRRRVTLTPKVEVHEGVYEGKLVLATEEQRREKAFPIFLMGDGKVKVASIVENGKDVISVNNGTMEFRICPSFGGIVYSLKRNGVEFLSSSFPEEKPMLWLNPWFGGLSGSINHQESKGWQEAFKARRLTRDLWKGVETSCKAKDSVKDVKGVIFKTRYLTVNSSNILRIEQEILNATTTRLEIFSGANVFVGMGNDQEIESVIPDENDRPYVRPRTEEPKHFDSEKAWVALRNTEFDASVVFAGPTGERASLGVNRARGMTVMAGHIRPYLNPGQSSIWRWHLALSSSDIEDIDRHKHIRELGPLTEPLY